jgi:signal transduction histidine kinase
MSSDFLIRHSNAAIAVLNTDFTIMEANECYLKMVNKTKADVIGAQCYKVHRGFEAPCPHAAPSLPCPMMETLRTGKSAHVIQEFSASGVATTYDNIVTYPLKDHKGKILRIIEIWRDITKEIASRWETRVKQIQADMNHLVQEDRMISLGKLVASCVHEINNPIQGMMMFTGLMQEILQKGALCNDDSVQFRHFLSLMATELERCGNIVSGLLSFSREAPNEFRNTDLNEVMDSVFMLTQHKMEMVNIQCELDLAEAPLIINGDFNRLQQCLLNLVFNAIEAMPSGGRLHMANRRSSSKKMATIEIEDNGEGVDEENMDHLFDPFFTTKEEGKGTGLGLSIVHGVVKMHRGDIRVKSRPGVGSKFTIKFPLIKS